MMNLAVSLPLSGVSTRRGLEIAQRAVEAGYSSIWLSEAQGPDAVSQLGALASTVDVPLGVAVLPVQTRSLFLLAMTAASLSEMTNGRFILGIGSSSEVIVRDWAGRDFDAPYTEVSEAFDILRRLLDRERVAHDGRFFKTKSYRVQPTTVGRIPIYLGALGQRMLRLAGAVADGVCLNQLGPHHVRRFLDLVKEGAAGHSRPLEGFGVVARLFCLVTDDVDKAAQNVRRTFAPYMATSVYNKHYRSLGYVAEADAALVAAAARDREAMAAAVSDRIINDLFVLGNARTVATKLRSYVEAGVTVPVIAPISDDPEEAFETFVQVADAFRAFRQTAT